ncbi:hypothetical protein D9542_03395 [Corynebacterium macginleyi]|nr:hypothetical protein D9V82_06740 [Corynebacterium macginleyi]RMB69411.1 hypothetical protein D9542_03395 [Corynebacterium macginleyi]
MDAVFLGEFQPRKSRTECRSANSTAVVATDKTDGVVIHAVREAGILVAGGRRNLTPHSALDIGKNELTVV